MYTYNTYLSHKCPWNTIPYIIQLKVELVLAGLNEIPIKNYFKENKNKDNKDTWYIVVIYDYAAYAAVLILCVPV